MFDIAPLKNIFQQLMKFLSEYCLSCWPTLCPSLRDKGWNYKSPVCEIAPRQSGISLNGSNHSVAVRLDQHQQNVTGFGNGLQAEVCSYLNEPLMFDLSCTAKSCWDSMLYNEITSINTYYFLLLYYCLCNKQLSISCYLSYI